MSEPPVADQPPAPHGRTRVRSRAAASLRIAAVAAVVLVVIGLVVVVVVRVFGPEQTVSVTGRLDVGGCVLVTDLGGGLLAVDETSCAGDAAIFYVSGFEPGAGSCVGAGVAGIRLDGRTLCLTPDFRVGRCYLLPRVEPTPQDYERKGCTTVAGAPEQPIVEVTRRVDGVARTSCGVDENEIGYTRPHPLAYCVRPTRPGPP